MFEWQNDKFYSNNRLQSVWPQLPKDLREARNRKGKWPGGEALQNFGICRQQFHGSRKEIHTNLQKKMTNSHFPLQFSNGTYSAWNIPVLAFFMLMWIAGQQRGTMTTKNLWCFTQLSFENSIHGKAGAHNPISSFHWQFHTSATLRPCWTFEIMAEHLSKKFPEFAPSRPEHC